VLRQKGDLQAAAAELRLAASQQPEDAEIRHNLGGVLLALHDLRGAIAELRQAVRLDPYSSEARLTLAQALQRVGEGEAAGKEREEAQKIDTLRGARGRAVVLLQAAGDHLRAGDTAKALPELREATTLSPDFAEAHYRLAEGLWQSSGDLAEIIKELHTVLELNADHAQAHYLLGLARKKQGMTGLAKAEFSRALELAPGLCDALRALAEMAETDRDWPRAIAEYQKYLAWRPKDDAAQKALSLAEENLKRK
jgi:tetratricopeptide (TPR) repeat protein